LKVALGQARSWEQQAREGSACSEAKKVEKGANERNSIYQCDFIYMAERNINNMAYNRKR